ncbi:zgc:123305 isoform X2 [Engraulis encrasicolus]|uniref:zgc:123305 isoform X2 n=1 Tax=Engraulis encrasicolus TaxID=184585 RepID=UPI002FD4323B
MNYVGQLAETVFVTVKELYRGLNPATLTGGIDVIVVRQPDGSLQCSPFHVRFGKLGVLRSKEKVVDIEINGEAVNLHMKLGDNGEAFFVEEHEDSEDRVPPHLCTSPIPMKPGEASDGEEPRGSGMTAASRRKKRRRKRARADSNRPIDDDSSSSDLPEQEEESALIASKSVYFSVSEGTIDELTTCASQAWDNHPHSEGELSPNESVFLSRPSSPKSDSELLVRQESLGPQMQWCWGGFPKVCPSERSSADSQRTPTSPITPSENSHFRTIQRQDSFDLGCPDPSAPPAIASSSNSSSTASGSPVTLIRPQPRTPLTDSHPTNSAFSFITHSTPQSPDAHQPQPQCLLPSPPQVETLTSGEEVQQQTSPSSSASPTVSPCLLQSAPGSPEDPTDLEPTDHSGATSSDNGGHSSSTTISSSSCSSLHNVELTLDSVDVVGSTPTSSFSPETVGPTVELDAGEGEGPSSSPDADSGIEPCAEGLEEDELRGGSRRTPTNQEEECPGRAESGEDLGQSEERPGSAGSGSKSSDGQGKKKGKRSQHLGPSDIYLDDLTKLDPEVAALYFPKSESELAGRPGADQSPQSGNQSPQSVGSANMDSGTEYLSDGPADTLDVTMSLCGRDKGMSQINKEKFMEHVVTFQQFVSNPGIIDDPNLVICINNKYYNWAVAAPMILSMQAFQRRLPKSTVEKLVKDKMPKKSGGWWFSWRRKDMNSSERADSKTEQHAQTDATDPLSAPSTSRQASEESVQSSTERRPSVTPGTPTRSAGAPLTPTLTLTTEQCISQMYRKSLRLTSHQIEQLNLREGANKVVFSVTTQYQGTCRCEAAIYLWNWDDRVIISDIDGTITKSDALGHILPQLGKDWTHHGIAKLYHKIHKNGYKFLYCSARAIGMSAITKGYLQWVNDEGVVLPKGPVLLAPSSLFSALHREVIEKKPEVFKIACLNDIRYLFNPQQRPFYAAFGNRTNDAYAYKEVGVSKTRIFTVNPKGELIREESKGNKSSYAHLSELVEHVFPLICRNTSSSASFHYPEYSQFAYWREPLPSVDLESV